MISELLNLIGTKDKNTVIFLMKLAICIISPTFCIILFFCPQLFKNFPLEVVIILSCTINIVVILMLYWLFSDKIKVVKNIKPIDKDSDYESFIKAKDKCINIVNESVLNRITNYMIVISVIIIVERIIYKYILSKLNTTSNDIINILNIIFIIINIIFFLIVVTSIYKDRKTIKEEAKAVEDKLREIRFLSGN